MLPLSYSFCLSESYRSSFNPFCFLRSFLTLQKAVIAPSDEHLGNLCWCYLTFWIVFLILSVVFSHLFIVLLKSEDNSLGFCKIHTILFHMANIKKKILSNLGEKHLEGNLTKVNELRGFPGGSVIKNSPANAGDTGSIPGSGRSPGEENWKPAPVLLPGKFHGQRKEPGRLQSVGSETVRHNWVSEHTQISGVRKSWAQQSEWAHRGANFSNTKSRTYYYCFLSWWGSREDHVKCII